MADEPERDDTPETTKSEATAPTETSKPKKSSINVAPLIVGMGVAVAILIAVGMGFSDVAHEVPAVGMPGLSGKFSQNSG